MDFLRRHVQRKTLLRQTHFLREGGVGLPGSGVAGVGLLHHLVDLLEGKTFGFGLRSDVLASALVLMWSVFMTTYDQEVGKGRGDAAEGTPEEEDFGAEVRVAFVGTDQVRGDDGNDLSWSASIYHSGVGQVSTYAVPEPVGGGGDTDTARSDGQREDLSNNHPRTRAPGGSEEGDVEADEGNHRGHRSVIIF